MPIESSQYFIILFRVNQVFTFYHFIVFYCLLNVKQLPPSEEKMPPAFPSFFPPSLPPATVDGTVFPTGGTGLSTGHHSRYRPPHRPPSTVPAFPRPPSTVPSSPPATVDGTHRRRWVICIVQVWPQIILPQCFISGAHSELRYFKITLMFVTL